jgi:hypothetical protein
MQKTQKKLGTLNEVQGRSKKSENVDKININGSLETDPLKIATEFNSFFRCYVYSSHYNLLAQHVGPQFISSLNFSFKISCHPRTNSPRSSLHPSLIWDQISCHPRTTSPKVLVTLPSGAKFHVIPQQVPPCTPCCGMT